MKLFGGKQKKGVQLIHVYDIGSASIGGALVLIESNKKPAILYAVRNNFSIIDAPDPARLQATLFSVLTKTAEDLQKEGNNRLQGVGFSKLHPDTVYCTVSSPWYVSQTRRIHKEYKRPTHISDADIRTRAEEEFNVFIASPSIQSIAQEKHTLIEQRIIQVKLNGYETSAPGGKEALTLDMTIVFSVMQSDIAAGITDIVRRVCPVSNPVFNTFPLVVFDALRGKKDIPEDMFIADVSGEVTDVSLVDDGVLLESVSFPVGKETMVREIAEILKTTPEEALSLLRMSHEKGIVGSDSQRVREALVTAVSSWKRSFEQTLSTLNAEALLPHVMYITSDSDIASWLKGIIEEVQRDRFSTEVGIHAVTTVDALFLFDLCDVSRDTERDAFLMLTAIYAWHALILHTEYTHNV